MNDTFSPLSSPSLIDRSDTFNLPVPMSMSRYFGRRQPRLPSSESKLLDAGPFYNAALQQRAPMRVFSMKIFANSIYSFAVQNYMVFPSSRCPRSVHKELSHPVHILPLIPFSSILRFFGQCSSLG